MPVTRAADCRLSPRPTGGEESHGLGLAIVKHLVEAQNGTAGADSGGSVFWCELSGGVGHSPFGATASDTDPGLSREGQNYGPGANPSSVPACTWYWPVRVVPTR